MALWDRQELRAQTWEENVFHQSSEAFANLCYKMSDSLKCLTRACLVKKLGELLGKSESMESVLLGRNQLEDASKQAQRQHVVVLLRGGYSFPGDEANIQSIILNALLGSTFPQTFCVANSSRILQFRPWEKAVILQDLSKSPRDPSNPLSVTSLELTSIAFELMWTLAALCKNFPGFQHNSLGTSVRLFQYGARSYRMRHSPDVAYYIPAGCPLPVIVNWSTANCKAHDTGLPYRVGESDDGKDVNDMLDAMLGKVSRELPPRIFKQLLKMKAFCTKQYYRYIKHDDGTLEADVVSEGNRACVPMILELTCPETFESRLGGCKKCVSSDGSTSSFKEGEEVCTSSTDTLQTTLIVSNFFDELLEPLPTSQIAIVESF